MTVVDGIGSQAVFDLGRWPAERQERQMRRQVTHVLSDLRRPVGNGAAEELGAGCELQPATLGQFIDRSARRGWPRSQFGHAPRVVNRSR